MSVQFWGYDGVISLELSEFEKIFPNVQVTSIADRRYVIGTDDICEYSIRLNASALDISRLIFSEQRFGYKSRNPPLEQVLIDELRDVFNCPCSTSSEPTLNPPEESLPFRLISGTGALGPSGIITNHGRVRVQNATELVSFELAARTEESDEQSTEE